MAEKKRPNILVLWGDDIGYWNVSLNNRGMMGYRTPNIDRIGEEGVQFTDYYGQQSCTAGRAAFITGQNPVRTGLTKVGVPGYVGSLLQSFSKFPPRQKACFLQPRHGHGDVGAGGERALMRCPLPRRVGPMKSGPTREIFSEAGPRCRRSGSRPRWRTIHRGSSDPRWREGSARCRRGRSVAAGARPYADRRWRIRPARRRSA